MSTVQSGDFVGRESEQDLYRAFLNRDTPWVLVITGLGGIGKSALFNTLEKNSDEDTCCVVTIDFNDTLLRTDPSAVLGKFVEEKKARCYNLPPGDESGDNLKEYLHQLTQLSAKTTKENTDYKGIRKKDAQFNTREPEDVVLREIHHQMRELATEAFYDQMEMFTRKHLVIMLDTCEWLNEPEGWEIGQWVLNEFVPELHTRLQRKNRLCSVVMASRIKPQLEVIDKRDQQHIALSMLDKRAVDGYLEQKGMQNPQLRQQVYETTHGHALCVSIIGQLWQERAEQEQPFTIADLPALGEFSEQALLQFTSERILKQLKSPFFELTRYGVLLRSFNLPLLRAVFSDLLPESRAFDQFAQLIRYPYIESLGKHRYAFHELLREALAKEIRKKEFENEKWKFYHERALEYFDQVARYSPDCYYHLFASDEKRGLIEWQRAIQEANEKGGSGALLQAALDKTLQLSPATFAEIQYEQGRFNYLIAQSDKAQKSYQDALDSFQRMEDYSGQAKVLRAMGNVQKSLNKHDDALKSYEQAQVLFREMGNKSEEANVLQAMGDVQQRLNKHDDALKSYEQAQVLFREMGNKLEEANVLQTMGDVQQRLNKHDDAIKSYEQALTWYQEQKDRLKRANVLSSIGYVQRLLYQQALAQYQKEKDRLKRDIVLGAKGGVTRPLQDKYAELAIENYRQALALYGELKEPKEEAEVQRAIDQVQQLLKEATQAQDPAGQMCNLVMQGGIASGFMYLPFVLELKKSYRFRNIGGTSIGVIAAAATAAAEYNRENGGFMHLENMRVRLSENGFLRSLFQPYRDTKPLMNLVDAFFPPSQLPQKQTRSKPSALPFLLSGPQFVGRLIRIWARYLPPFSLSLLWGTIIGFVVALPLPLATFGTASLLSTPEPWYALLLKLAYLLIFGASGAWLGLQVGGVVDAITKLPDNFYGICTGHSNTVPNVLTDWLSKQFDKIAGLEKNRPLTFGDLKSKKLRAEQPDTQNVSIILKMGTSNLSQGQPYIIPSGLKGFLFKESDMHILFPDYIVDHMVIFAARSPIISTDKLPIGYHFLPDEEHLPVVVGARMNLSFPILMSAVPLYTINVLAFQRIKDGTQSEVHETDLQVNWFGDGEICTHLPIDFFDSWLPKWPTFGINLISMPAKWFEYENQQPVSSPNLSTAGPADVDPERLSKASLSALDPNYEIRTTSQGPAAIYLPRADAPQDHQWSDLQGVWAFLLAIISTRRDYHDTLQMNLPGYREQVVQIRLSDAEGGLHLNIPPEVIETIAHKGQQAGMLVREFDFERHRWMRFLTLMARLEQNIEQMEVILQDPELVQQLRTQAATHSQYPYNRSMEWYKEAGARVDDLRRLIGSWQKADEERDTPPLFLDGWPVPDSVSTGNINGVE